MTTGLNTMTKQKYILILLACLLSLSAGRPSVADDVKSENSQKCISTRTLKSTRIVDDRNILFFRPGKTVYLNILPKACPGLSKYGLFTYGGMAGNVCARDTIRVIDNNNGSPGRACLLGYFHKMNKDDLPGLFESRQRPIELIAPPAADVEDVTENTGESEEEPEN